jgi:hypothetical protein
MEIVEQKFNNFKTFLKTVNGISATYIQIIELVTLEQFFNGLKQHYKDKPVNDLITEIASKASMI